MDSDRLFRIQEAIRGESLDGWLFSNFRHRDPLSDEILGLDTGSTNTRLWLYAIPCEGEPFGIVPSIENTILDGLSGTMSTYLGEKSLDVHLAKLSGKRWGVHLDREIAAISRLDAGLADRLREAGLTLVSAAPLIQRLKGLLDTRMMESHKRASAHLHAIVREIWAYLESDWQAGKRPTEGRVRRLILKKMEERGLETDHPPIVAAGRHSANPHYDFEGSGSRINDGDVLQLDLWAREKGAGSIYADISWIGIYGSRIQGAVGEAFKDLIAVRDQAVAYIRGELSCGIRPTGAAVDRFVRMNLIARGYAKAIRHRTGHGIDTECHGSGANLDSFEFPDRRVLLDGACFSVEPGIYLENFGLRTEINVHIADGTAFITDPTIQAELLICSPQESPCNPSPSPKTSSPS